jgi:hypothetical protein
MHRTTIPFSGTYISGHPDPSLSGSTMTTTLYQFRSNLGKDRNEVKFSLDSLTEQYRIELGDYYRDIINPDSRRKN